jgi:hypothetical protein
MGDVLGILAGVLTGGWLGGGPTAPGLAAGVLLAEIGKSHFLAVGLMIAGAIVLRHALRPRKKGDDVAGMPLEMAMERLKATARASELAAEVEAKPGAGDHSAGAEGIARAGGDDLRVVVAEARQLRGVLADEADRHAARLEELIARAEEAIRRLETLSPSDAAARSRHAGDGGPERLDPLNRRIYELADQGLPPVEIARSLSQQTGKVELVLALRPR